jgi:hypothetical protein
MLKLRIFEESFIVCFNSGMFIRCWVSFRSFPLDHLSDQQELSIAIGTYQRTLNERDTVKGAHRDNTLESEEESSSVVIFVLSILK